MADLAVWQRTIVDEKGNVIPGAEVSVRSYPGGSLITLYEDPDGAQTKNNPFITGSDGFARFWASSQRAEIVARGAGSTIRWVVDLLNADEVIGGAVTEATAAAAVAVGEAEAAADRAEAARDAAQLNAHIYPNVSDGLAATTDGDYFSVPSPDDDEYLILYHNDSGSAVEVSRTPSANAIWALVGEAALVTDWNGINRSGFYRGSGSTGEMIGLPEARPHMRLLHVEANEGRASQMAFQSSASTPRTWVRSRALGEWSDWKELAWQESLDTLVGEAKLSLDWDAIGRSGFYRGSGSTGEMIGLPEARPHMRLLHVEANEGRASQMAFQSSASTPRTWVRSRALGEWSDWKELAWQESLDALEASMDAFLGEAKLSLDWDAIDKPGFYRGSYTSSVPTEGAPADRPFLGLMHIQKDGGRHHQLAFRQNTQDPQMWVRSRNSVGVWGEWKELARLDYLTHLRTLGAFYTGEETVDTSFALVSENGVVLSAWGADGQQTVGGGSLDISSLPLSEQDVGEGEAWSDRSRVSVRPAMLDVNKTATRTMFPDVDAVHQYLDGLVAEFPDYLSSEKIGEDRLGNDIKVYRATPPRYVEIDQGSSYPESQVAKPKIIIVSGLHGNEAHPVSANIVLLEEICRQWRRIERLDQYRWGLDLLLVPVASPSGYNARTRNNSAGVNLNRNFPTRWANTSESGSAPASEPETQALISLIEAHDDAIGLIDHHRMFQYNNDEGERLVWVAAEGSGNVGVALNVVNASISEVKRRFPFVPQTNEPVGSVSSHFNGALELHADALGVPGFLLETPDKVSGTTEQTITHARRCADNLIWELYQKELARRRFEYIL